MLFFRTVSRQPVLSQHTHTHTSARGIVLFRIVSVRPHGDMIIAFLFIRRSNKEFRVYLHGEKLSLVGGLPSPPSHLLPSVYMKKVVPVDRAKTWPSRVRACSICPDLSLVGETTIAKVFTWNPPQGHPTFKASNPPPRVTLPPEPTLRFLM